MIFESVFKGNTKIIIFSCSFGISGDTPFKMKYQSLQVCFLNTDTSIQIA